MSRVSYPSPTRRLVLLGASNVVLALPRIVTLARQISNEPVEIMAAVGHGRSYGRDSWVFGRKFSGIFSSQLWEDLRSRPALPTMAVVTDIGNDILYEVPSERILKWIDACLDRLNEHAAQTVGVGLPMDSIARLGTARFLLYRSLLFPRSRLTLESAQAEAKIVNQRLREMAQQKKITIIPAQNNWYGFDPVHIRPSARNAAWTEILTSWADGVRPNERAKRSIFFAAYIYSLPPFERQVFGFAKRRDQPTGRWTDGTTLSLY